MENNFQKALDKRDVLLYNESVLSDMEFLTMYIL